MEFTNSEILMIVVLIVFIISKRQDEQSPQKASCRMGLNWGENGDGGYLWCCQTDGCGGTVSYGCKKSTDFFASKKCQLPDVHQWQYVGGEGGEPGGVLPQEDA